MQNVYSNSDRMNSIIEVDLLDYPRLFIRKGWICLLVLVFVCTGGLLILKHSQFAPLYSAKIYYSVYSTGDVETDATLTARMAAGVATITATADFCEEMSKQLGNNTSISRCSFSGQATESANLFTVTICGSDPSVVNQAENAFKIVYPSWATRSMGNCSITVNDERFSDGTPINSWAKKKIIFLGIMIGVFLWFLFGTFHIFTARKAQNENSMFSITSVPCMGRIPEIKKKKRERSVRETLLLTNPNINRRYIEAIRSIRQQIEQELSAENKVFLITGTRPQEGKSLITLNLALTLREKGLKTALIDGDVRKGGLSELLAIDSEQAGLSDYLNSDRGLRISIREGMWVVSSGTATGLHRGKNQEEKLEWLLKHLKKNVDVILIDSPPVSLFGDAIDYAEVCDAVFYVVRTEYAELREIKRGIEPFNQSGKLKGYILNRVHYSGLGYGYGHRYRYGYGYGYSDRGWENPNQSNKE